MTVDKTEFFFFHLGSQSNGVLLALADPVEGAPNPLGALELIEFSEYVGDSEADEGVGLVLVEKHFAFEFILDLVGFT